MTLFGDLARRLTIANPNLENPLLGEGVVLIDEIELHMHPFWQRNVVGKLREAFPNIQFIITTHSPIVLSEIDDEFNIYFLQNNEAFSGVIEFKRLNKELVSEQKDLCAYCCCKSEFIQVERSTESGIWHIRGL